MLCSFSSCQKQTSAKTFCRGHYAQHLLGKPMRTLKPRGRPRLTTQQQNEIKELANIQILQGRSISLSTQGYPVVHIAQEGGRPKELKIHRLVMEVAIGRPLSRKEIVHHGPLGIMNPSIGNLRLHASQSAHMRTEHSALRGIALMNAVKISCKRGHKLNGANLRKRSDGRGCRTCQNLTRAMWRKRRRAQGFTPT